MPLEFKSQHWCPHSCRNEKMISKATVTRKISHFLKLDPPKVRKLRSHKKMFYLIKTPKVLFPLFFHLGWKGVVSGGPKGGSHPCKAPQKPLVWGLVCRKEHLPWEDLWGGKVSLHVLYTFISFAALAGDDSPGQQCTEITSHVYVMSCCILPELQLVHYRSDTLTI